MSAADKPWRPGDAAPKAAEPAPTAGWVPVDWSKPFCAMTRTERTSRLQYAFLGLHESERGLKRDQELTIMEALDALP